MRSRHRPMGNTLDAKIFTPYRTGNFVFGLEMAVRETSRKEEELQTGFCSFRYGRLGGFVAAINGH